MTNFVIDSFTATGGTALESHVSDSGSAWVKNSVFSSASLVISPSGDVRTSTTFNGFYTSAAVHEA